MKLYNVPRKTFVKTITGDIYFFDHIDGMYSYCINEINQVVHLVAWTEVDIVDMNKTLFEEKKNEVVNR